MRRLRCAWRLQGRRLLTAIACGAAIGGASAQAPPPPPTLTSPANVTFSPAETKRALSLGPWPRAWRPDPTNRVSGKVDAIELGRRLFFDARLSGQGTHACSSCHRPETAFMDGRPTAQGLALSKRNTPSLIDVRTFRWFGWDGAADSLWAQSLRPILDPREMGSNADHVRSHIASDAGLSELYQRLFARTASATGAEDVLVDAAKALAAYQETLISAPTAFDAFRDRLATNAVRPDDPYPAAARRGLRVFVGPGQCARCHAGPAFSHGEFERLRKDGGGIQRSSDAGRFDGINRLLASPHTLRSRFSDADRRAPFWSGRGGGIGIDDRNRGAFRVPGLRGVTQTAPYMHDGSVATLAEAVAHAVPATQIWKSRRRALTADEIADVVAFLETLSSP